MQRFFWKKNQFHLEVKERSLYGCLKSELIPHFFFLLNLYFSMIPSSSFIFCRLPLYVLCLSGNVLIFAVDQMSPVSWRSMWWQCSVVHSYSDQCCQSKWWCILNQIKGFFIYIYPLSKPSTLLITPSYVKLPLKTKIKQNVKQRSIYIKSKMQVNTAGVLEWI